MKRTIKRDSFELNVELTDDKFIAPPTPSQRNWVIQRAMEELADDLTTLDDVCKNFVDGSVRQTMVEKWAKSQAKYDDTQLIIDGQQVMQDWERPYMEAMSEVVTATHGDVLEIGFGMAISASYMQSMGVKSYTVIECNEGVRGEFEKWKAKYPGRDINLVFGKWQDVIDDLGLYDGIFFDTYPLSEEEFNDYVVRDVTFAEHFFEAAARHLKPGGIFTYYSNEIDSLSRRHQRSILKHFKSITISECKPLFPPADCNYWWAESMCVTTAIK